MTLLSITAKTANSPSEIKTQALVVLTPERKTLSPYLKVLDTLLGGTVSRSIKQGDFSGSEGSHMWLPGAGGIQRVLLIGCGDPAKQTTALAKKVGESIARTLVSSPAADALIVMEGLTTKLSMPAILMEQMSLQLTLAHYQYGQTLKQTPQAPTNAKAGRNSGGNALYCRQCATRYSGGRCHRTGREPDTRVGESAGQYLYPQIPGQRGKTPRTIG